MLPRSFILLLFLCSLAQAQTLTSGMSVKDVESELGRPESTMELGAKEVLIYGDGIRLEFVDGKLVKENDKVLTLQNTSGKEAPVDEDPLIRAEDIVKNREDQTIGASVNTTEIDYASLANSKTLEKLQDEIGTADAAALLDERATRPDRLQQIAIAFGIEILVSLLVLAIAFQISGFPAVFRQLFVLSLAVAIAGALLHTLLGVGLLNPIRSAAGFGIFLVLIRPLTDVRKWVTAIKIALIARLVSLAIMWVLMIAASALFSF